MVVAFTSCLSLSRQLCPSNYIAKNISPRKYKRYLRTVCVKRSSISISLPFLEDDGDVFGTRVFVLSDLHTDYAENMKWVKCLSTVRYKNNGLIVAGDVAETYNNFVLTMSILKDRFEYVFYVPGNHDLWCRRDGEDYLDSLEKLSKLLDACRELGVETDPMVVEDLGIIPLFSWYHESFDKEKDIANIRVPSLEMACKDFHACKWPENLSSGDTSLALYFDFLNERNQNVIKKIQRTCSQILHFLTLFPGLETVAEYRLSSKCVLLHQARVMSREKDAFYPKLPKIIGSDCLEHRIRSIHGFEGGGSACHVFGHTHFCWDAVIDGVRYVQAPLAYPRERKRNMNGGENWLPFCVYSRGKFCNRISPCYWSDYYSENPRTPHVTDLAPWVARFYHRT